MLIRSWEGWGRLPGRTGTFRVALQAADLGLGDCVGTPTLREPAYDLERCPPQPRGLLTGRTLPAQLTSWGSCLN